MAVRNLRLPADSIAVASIAYTSRVSVHVAEIALLGHQLLVELRGLYAAQLAVFAREGRKRLSNAL